MKPKLHRVHVLGSSLLLLLLTSPGLAQRERGFARGSDRGGGSGEIWDALAKRYDADSDGRITSEEYTRGQSKFMGYDANQDGVLTVADFEGGRGRGFGMRGLGRELTAADADGDGGVSAQEWKAWLASLEADADGVVPGDKLSLPGPAEARRGGGGGSLDRDRDGKLELSDLELVHTLVDVNGDGVLGKGELAGGPSREGAPQAGAKAPDFELVYAKEPGRKVRLSSFAGKRPVALVFGSYT